MQNHMIKQDKIHFKRIKSIWENSKAFTRLKSDSYVVLRRLKLYIYVVKVCLLRKYKQQQKSSNISFTN